MSKMPYYKNKKANNNFVTYIIVIFIAGVVIFVHYSGFSIVEGNLLNSFFARLFFERDEDADRDQAEQIQIIVNETDEKKETEDTFYGQSSEQERYSIYLDEETKNFFLEAFDEAIVTTRIEFNSSGAWVYFHAQNLPEGGILRAELIDANGEYIDDFEHLIATTEKKGKISGDYVLFIDYPLRKGNYMAGIRYSDPDQFFDFAGNLIYFQYK